MTQLKILTVSLCTMVLVEYTSDQPPLYKDASANIESRIEDLISRIR